MTEREPWRTYFALIGVGLVLQVIGMGVTQISRPVGGVLVLVGAIASLGGGVSLIRYLREEDAR